MKLEIAYLIINARGINMIIDISSILNDVYRNIRLIETDTRFIMANTFVFLRANNNLSEMVHPTTLSRNKNVNIRNISSAILYFEPYNTPIITLAEPANTIQRYRNIIEINFVEILNMSDRSATLLMDLDSEKLGKNDMVNALGIISTPEKTNHAALKLPDVKLSIKSDAII